MRSADALHSFWVPSLAGKLDLIPGKNNTIRLKASHAGVMRGQCAEYCGGPHAQMALFAEESDRFERWLESQRLPASPPADARLVQGEQVFLEHCAACHTVRGTRAAGVLGPDLTHVGGRLSIAAGMLPNNAGTIAGWIGSSQHIKTGNLMPAFAEFNGETLNAVAAYVESLD